LNFITFNNNFAPVGFGTILFFNFYQLQKSAKFNVSRLPRSKKTPQKYDQFCNFVCEINPKNHGSLCDGLALRQSLILFDDNF
jgi:hypothetical protein